MWAGLYSYFKELQEMSLLALKLLGTADGPKVRGMMHEGSGQYSVYDFMTMMCKYESSGATARKEFKRLTRDGSEYRNEIVASCHNLHFPGQRGAATPCMTIRGLQRLLMILGGKVAAEFREIVEGTFTRVMAGDQSLIEVINANAVSDAPVQQAYRQALAQEPVAPVLDDFCLNRKREREDLLFDMEMAERRRVLNRNLIQDASDAMEAISALKDLKNVDERTKMQTEDHIKNVLFNRMAGPTVSAADQPTNPLNVSILAKELGFKCTEGELQCIGRQMAKKYRETYHSDPPKHKQYVGGNFIPINSYLERDRSLMEGVIRTVMAKP